MPKYIVSVDDLSRLNEMGLNEMGPADVARIKHCIKYAAQHPECHFAGLSHVFDRPLVTRKVAIERKGLTDWKAFVSERNSISVAITRARDLGILHTFDISKGSLVEVIGPLEDKRREEEEKEVEGNGEDQAEALISSFSQFVRTFAKSKDEHRSP